MGKVKESLKRCENGYLFADITFWGAIGILFWKKEPMYFACLLIIYVIVVCKTIFNQGTKVINNYDKDILAKDEDSDVVHIVKSGEYKGNVDGIRVDGKVYKLPDGVRATVTRTGKIRFYSAHGLLFYWAGGGELTSAPDASWDKLFPTQAQED